MLNFFRKYQTYFFAVITVVIIISFSFFGTYNTLPANSIHEQVAFTAVDGTEVKRHELDELVLFISTDTDDKRLFGGMWGPNFLNDGVIRNDILTTGLGEILINTYPGLVEQDLQTKLEKEKRFALYKHPYAPFLTTESAWAYFAPNMKTHFDALRGADIATNPDAVNARVALFLEEKRFSAPLLKQVLRYQQKQYNWLTPDPNLERLDLSLFGYHTVDDWFGPKFLRIVGEFIINSSKIAEQKGYQVSKAEVLADLMKNSEISFKQNIQNPNLGVTNSTEYFNEQLRRLGMDRTKAVHVWQQVMLFRRMFQDVGNSALVDPLMSQSLYAYANETITGDLYKLPPELRFADYRTMQKFEAYLDAVSKRSKENDQDLLALPTTFNSIEKVKKKTPELVQKRYLLEVAQVQKSALNARVGIKETWNWEVNDANWPSLKQEFPELGIKAANTRDERLAALNGLDDVTRARVDQFARKAIVKSHPEWIKEALDGAEPTVAAVNMHSSGGKALFGLENRDALMALLDKAPLPNEEANEEAKEAASKLENFTGDGEVYYRIVVLKRAPDEEVATFAEANREGVLDALLDHQLEVQYVKVRESHPEKFQREDKTWKNFADVKDAVADIYYEKLLNAIRQDYSKATNGKGQQPTTSDLAASVRLYAYARGLMDNLKKVADPATLTQEAQKSLPPEQAFEKRLGVSDQWKLEHIAYKTDRSKENGDVDLVELYKIPVNSWSMVHTPVNGDLYFVQLKDRSKASDVTTLYDQQHIASELIADDAQRVYMHDVLKTIKEKNAISLDYMNTAVEMTADDVEKTN